MRIFLSHATADTDVAQTLRLRLDELVPERISCFLLTDDVFPSDDWEAAIRAAAKDCDVIVSLVTPSYVNRPWFHIEWAAFWIQEKPWYLLTHEVEHVKIIDPMRRRQLASLDDRRSVERFLLSLAKPTIPPRVDILAAEIVAKVRTAFEHSAAKRLGSNLAHLSTRLQKGTANVKSDVLKEIARAQGLSTVVTMTIDSGNSVSMRQVAVVLLDMQEYAEAASITSKISNLGERRTVGQHALKLLAERGRSQPLEDLILQTYASVGGPQRRDLRTTAEQLGSDIRWPEP